MMGLSVAVIGASGYAGGELLRLLDGHPEFAVTGAVAHRAAGRTLGEIHPQLSGLAGLRLQEFGDLDLAALDLVFLALPHGESAGIAPRLPDSVRIVDLGADFRHHADWTYGLPELPGAPQRIAASARVANPGCYATAITLAFAPLVASGLIERAGRRQPLLSVVASSGVSGAGRSPSERLLGAEVMGDLSVYKVAGTHQHIPEIEQSLSRIGPEAPRLSFTPVLAPMPRGILAVCGCDLADGVTDEVLRGAIREAYAEAPFVRLLPDGQWPRTGSVLGSNADHLQATVEAGTGRGLVIAAIDNLGKGAAGQAIQNANLMVGLPGSVGLPVNGCAP